jgi:hypothetical protein
MVLYPRKTYFSLNIFHYLGTIMTLPAVIAEIEKLENFTTKKTVLSKLKTAAALLAQAKIELTASEPAPAPEPTPDPEPTPVAEKPFKTKTRKKPEPMPVGG